MRINIDSVDYVIYIPEKQNTWVSKKSYPKEYAILFLIKRASKENKFQSLFCLQVALIQEEFDELSTNA